MIHIYGPKLLKYFSTSLPRKMRDMIERNWIFFFKPFPNRFSGIRAGTSPRLPTDDRPLAKNGDKPERHITHTHTYITHTQRGSPWGVHAYAKDADADENEDEFESVWVTLIRALRTPLTLRSAFEIGSTLDLVCHLGVIIAPDQESR